MSQDVEKSKNVSNRKKSDFLKEEDEDLLQASPIANRKQKLSNDCTNEEIYNQSILEEPDQTKDTSKPSKKELKFILPIVMQITLQNTEEAEEEDLEKDNPFTLGTLIDTKNIEDLHLLSEEEDDLVL